MKIENVLVPMYAELAIKHNIFDQGARGGLKIRDCDQNVGRIKIKVFFMKEDNIKYDLLHLAVESANMKLIQYLIEIDPFVLYAKDKKGL